MARLGALPVRLVRGRGIRVTQPRDEAGIAIRPGLLLPLFVALVAITTTTSARAHEQVTVRTGLHPGFGRLVLEWPAPVEIDGSQEGSRYLLRFGRPLEVVLDSAVARLGAYLKSAHLERNERELVLDLAPGIAVRQAVEDGRIAVLDLAPDSTAREVLSQGRIVVSDLPPVVPAEQVKVRAGVHDGFGRVVFEWSVPTTFEAAAAARQVDIRFSRIGDIDTTTLATRLEPWLQQASASRGDRRSHVRLDLQPDVAARVFQVDDHRIVVDLRRDAQAVRQEAEVRAHAPPASPAENGAAVAAGIARPEPTSSGPAAAVRPSVVSGPAPPEPGIEPAHPSDPPTAAAGLDEGGSLDFALTRPVAAAVFVRGAYLWVVFAAETNRPQELAMPTELRDYAGPGERIAASGGMALRFALRRPLAAAAWRDDRTWRVRLSADGRAPRSLYPLRLAAPARLRLVAGEPVRLVIVRDPETGDQLTVWPLLQPDLGQPRQSLVEIELLATAQGLAWRPRSDRVQARVIGDAVEFDALGGLALSEPPGSEPSVVAPAAAESSNAIGADAAARHAPAGQAEPRSAGVIAAAPAHVSREAEPSDAGAVAPTHRPAGATGRLGENADAPPPADKLAARTEPAQEPSFLERRPIRPAGPAAPLGLVGWEQRSTDTEPQRRAALLQALAQAAPDDRAARRVDLARHYLSRALAAEALGVLGRVDGPEDEAARAARTALRGAAELLMGRIDRAAGELGAAAFDDDPEVALWRAAIAAGQHDWPQAERELARSREVLSAYPQALRVRLGLAAASIAIETENAELAATVLAQLQGLELARDERARLAFLSGVASAHNGAIETADEIWRALEQDAPVDVRIQAAFARTELLLQTSELKPGEAIARLKATRSLWPGHPWEERMLNGLARIQMDAGDRPGALRTWRELLKRFPATVDAQAITTRMREALIASLGADGEAGLEPVQAYALFREFEQLIPHDEPGDGLRRRMAERLAALDLIRPAAASLETLLDGWPAGVDKAAAGADLAELWLREPDPEAALAALERSRIQTPLPAALDQRRRILQAAALTRLERRTAALSLLDGLDTPAADQLRVALFWQQQDWSHLVFAIEAALARRPASEAPWTENAQAMVVQLALAYGHLGQSAALAQLRTRFAAGFRDQPLEPAFLMATVASDATLEPEAILAQAEQHLQRVRGYLDSVHATN